jgi:hypothetical protein
MCGHGHAFRTAARKKYVAVREMLKTELTGDYEHPKRVCEAWTA